MLSPTAGRWPAGGSGNSTFVNQTFQCALFLLVVFPVLYLGAGTVETLPKAVEHSLLLSKIGPGDPDRVSGPVEMFLRVAQALIVGVAAGAAALVFYRKLEMKRSGAD